MEVIKRGPGRPPKVQEVASGFESAVYEKPIGIDVVNSVIPIKTIPPVNTKRLAKIVHMGIGCDLLGSQTSLNANRGNLLEVTDLGIVAVSKKNGRRVLIPWSNVRGCELYPE